MNQLDHLIVFLTGPDDVAALFPEPGDLNLDPGMRQVGQGTRNRRVIFSNCYLELVWVDSPVEARTSGLRFEERCAGAACPFGVVFRGHVPDAPSLMKYTVPNGPTLKIMDRPRVPFIAVYDGDDPDTSQRMRRTSSEYPNPARVTRAEVSVDRFHRRSGCPGSSSSSGNPA